MGSEGEKPDIVSGFANAFFAGVPYDPMLSRGEQALKVEIEEAKLMRDQNKILRELATAVSRPDRSLAPAFADLERASYFVEDRLIELDETLQQGLIEVGNQVETAGENITGIPATRKSAVQLVDEGRVDLMDALVYGYKGALKHSEYRQLLATLSDWQRNMFTGNLIKFHNPEFEATLEPPQKAFLLELRRRVPGNIVYSPALYDLAKNQVLEPEFHHASALKIRELRFGTEGTNLGMRELNEQTGYLLNQGDTAIGQRQSMIRQGEVNIAFHAFAAHQRHDQIVELRTQTGILGAIAGIQEQIHDYLEEWGGDVLESLEDIDESLSDGFEYVGGQLEDLNETAEAISEELQEVNTRLRKINTTGKRIATSLDAMIDANQENAAQVVNILKAIRASAVNAQKEASEIGRNPNKTDGEENFRIALELLKMGDIETALRHFTKSEEAYPLDHRIYFFRALCEIALDQPASAKKDILKTLRRLSVMENQAETQAAVLRILAQVEFTEAKIALKKNEMKPYKELLGNAKEHVRNAIKLDPQNIDAQFDLCLFLVDLKLFDEAIPELFMLFSRNPGQFRKVIKHPSFQPIMNSFKNTVALFKDPKSEPSDAEIRRTLKLDEIPDQEDLRKMAIELHDRLGRGECENDPEANFDLCFYFAKLGLYDTVADELFFVFKRDPKSFKTIMARPEFKPVSKFFRSTTHLFKNPKAEPQEGEILYALMRDSKRRNSYTAHQEQDEYLRMLVTSHAKTLLDKSEDMEEFSDFVPTLVHPNPNPETGECPEGTLIKTIYDGVIEESTAENCYALAALGIKLNISPEAIFEALERGLEEDADFPNNNSAVIRKLKDITGKHFDAIRTLLKEMQIIS
ncbi:MAG: hypothetical protein WC873_02560 [Candidatus Gracilibacteria bacterium]